MDVMPSDTRFRDAVVDELRQITRRPTVAWMGFMNLIQVTVHCELFDEEARVIERGLRHYKCYKAILWVRAYEAGKRRGTVVLMGTREVFAVTYDSHTGETAWETPDRFDQMIVSEFQGWEEETTS